MSIQFDCENCQKKLKVPQSAAGKRGRCNQCGHLNTIPAVASAEVISDALVTNDGAAVGGVPIGSGASAQTYNVKSAVNGAVFGPADSATLQKWLNEGRITPNCQLQQTGSQTWTMASQMFPTLGAAASAATGNVDNAFSQFQGAPADKNGEINPYARSHSGNLAGVISRQEIVPTTGDIGFCISHGWKVWTENFGLLLAVSATTVGVSYFLQIVQGVLQAGLTAIGDLWVMVIGLGIAFLVSFAVQMWLGLGCTKLLCQLCRGERAEYATLFALGGRVPLAMLFLFLLYLPLLVIGGGLFLILGPDAFQGNQEAVGVMVAIAMICLGIFSLFMLTIWPIYYMLADTKLSLGEMVSKGFAVGLKNCLIAIPVFFVAGLTMALGLIACGIGVIATIPAGQAMIVTAYLNMSGQLRPQ